VVAISLKDEKLSGFYLDVSMYIKRNQDGAIIAISQIAAEDVSEFVGDNSAEVNTYIQSLKPVPAASLEQSDQAMARVLEDVINLLVDQGTIRFTDLPEAAQTKLLSRRELRGQRQGMNLLDDGDDLKI
jgi:hypothetical protein